MGTIQVFKIKKRPWYERVVYFFIFKYLLAKMSYDVISTGVKMWWGGEPRLYYNYHTKKVMMMSGFDYIKQVRIDLGEVAYFNTKDGVVRAELF